MYINKMSLTSFKSYESCQINFDSKFNVLIGENNVGKTTIFEALQLWKKCFGTCITSKKNTFYSEKTSLYVNFEDLYFLRLGRDDDIFYGSKRSCDICIEIIDDDGNSHNLGFKLTKPNNIANAYIRIAQIDSLQFINFAKMLANKKIKLNDFMLIQQTSPVANVVNKEPYMYLGQIKKKIEKGKSNEVLRNKIINSMSKSENLINWMKKVLDIEFSFSVPNRSSKEKDEYVNLEVLHGDNKLDIYLQGSGFLQTAEIFSSIDIMDNMMNVLLIDEPDSHISPRIQNNLLCCLKEINNTQIFVISHNDYFVSSLNSSNIIFINNENKSNGSILPLDDVNIDSLHSSLGGIISGLTRLNKSKKILFFEGDDDIAYIRLLNDALKRISSHHAIDMSALSFWHIRGKDNLIKKIEHGKQLLSQAVPKCYYGSVFDKDFSTTHANDKFIVNVGKKLGKNNLIHVHDGYCIESVLFSDLEILEKFLRNIITDVEFDIEKFIADYMSSIKSNISNTNTSFYVDMKNKFRSQKTESRTELKDVEFDDYSSEASQFPQYIMNKDNIAQFIKCLEKKIDTCLVERDDDLSETIASKLLELYFKSISCNDDIYPDFIELIDKISKF